MSRIRSRRGSRRRLSAPRPFAALLIALTVLFVHGARLSHALLVQHAVCEHGDVVHAEHAAHEEHDAEGSTIDALNEDRRGGGPGADDDHDHCDANAVVHGVALPSPVIPPATLLTVDPPGGRALRGNRPVAQLPLAPKASPPVG